MRIPNKKKSSKPDEATKPAISSAVAPAVVPTVAVAAEPIITPAASAVSTLDRAPAAKTSWTGADRRRSPHW